MTKKYIFILIHSLKSGRKGQFTLIISHKNLIPKFLTASPTAPLSLSQYFSIKPFQYTTQRDAFKPFYCHTDSYRRFVTNLRSTTWQLGLAKTIFANLELVTAPLTGSSFETTLHTPKWKRKHRELACRRVWPYYSRRASSANEGQIMLKESLWPKWRNRRVSNVNRRILSLRLNGRCWLWCWWLSVDGHKSFGEWLVFCFDDLEIVLCLFEDVHCGNTIEKTSKIS